MTCSHIEICGGCKRQQMPYQEQLAVKQGEIEALFGTAEAIVGGEPWRYRGKMEFSFSQDKKGTKYLGLVMPKSRGRVFQLTECHIAPPWMAEVVQQVRAWWEQEEAIDAFFAPKGIGCLRTLTLRSSRDGNSQMVILTVSGAITSEALQRFNQVVCQENRSVFLVVQQAKKGQETRFFELHLSGPTTLTETLCGTEFRISPLSFFQPNATIAEAMFKKGIAMLKLTGEEKVLDLYCGMGTIGILLAKHVRQVVGIELSKSSVADAKEALHRLGIHNMQVYAEDAGTFLEKGLFTPDIIVVDPPRAGLDKKALAAIQALAPKKILYISCNPTTQKENIEALEGYRVVTVAPFDPFPHTPHKENLVLLEAIQYTG